MDGGAGLGAGKRRGGKDHIGQRFAQNAAEAEQHAGAELRIAHQAGDQLEPGGDHLGNQQPFGAVAGAGLRQQPDGGGAQRGFIGQVQPHQAALGLVGNARAAELGRHRVADLRRQSGGGIAVGGQALPRHRHAELGQQLLCGVLGECVCHGLPLRLRRKFVC